MIPRFLQSTPAAILLCAAAALADTAPVANSSGVTWRCAAAGSAEAVALLPAAALGAVVNRFAGLYSTRVLGLVQSKDRVYLLGAGGVESRTGLWADVISAGPADREFVAQRHVFKLVPGPRGGVSAADGYICLAGAEADRHGLTLTEQGDVTLAAGRSVALFDPSDPSVVVELRAADHAAMSLRETAALSGRLGIYAGLMRQRGQPNANIAVQGAGGQIVFKAIPGALPEDGALSASRGRIDLTVRDAGKPKVAAEAAAALESRAIAPAAKPAAPASGAQVVAPISRSGEEQSAAATAEARAATVLPEEDVPVAAAKEPVAEPGKPDTRAETIAVARPAAVAPIVPAPSRIPDAARGGDSSYASALRKLMERQGTGSVRSVSELTRVHPAVDALRAALR